MTEPLDVHKIMAEHRTHLSSVDDSGRCVVGYPTKTTELCAPDHCLTYRLAEEHEGYPELADLMSDTLRKVANALNGPPPELTSWSWHDLPERAQELVEKIAEQEAALERAAALTRNPTMSIGERLVAVRHELDAALAGEQP